MQLLKWHNAVVIGATGRLGSAFARGLYAQGAHLHLHCHSNTDAARVLAQEVEGQWFAADLTAPDGRRRLSEALTALPSLEILVVALGASGYGALASQSERDIERLISVNLTAPVFAVQAGLPLLLGNSFGRILIVGSVWGLEGASGEVVYSAAKAGIHGFVRALARELQGTSVTVNAIAPWAFESPMTAGFTEEERAAMDRQTPSRRPLCAEDIVAASSPFLNPDIGNLSGQVLTVGRI